MKIILGLTLAYLEYCILSCASKMCMHPILMMLIYWLKTQIKKHKEALLNGSKDVSLEVNTEKKK